jgi:hypothetical protein
MFTAIAFFGVAAVAFLVDRHNTEDRKQLYCIDDGKQIDEQLRGILLLHIRQDLKLIAFALFAIVVMLGVIADRIRG